MVCVYVFDGFLFVCMSMSVTLLLLVARFFPSTRLWPWVYDLFLFLCPDGIEEFIFCYLCHQTMNQFNRCAAAVSRGFCQFVIGAFFIRITTWSWQKKKAMMEKYSYHWNKVRSLIVCHVHILETTNGPRPRLASLCSSFSDRSKIWPVVYSVLLNKPELPNVFTQYLFHSESNSLRSKADLK